MSTRIFSAELVLPGGIGESVPDGAVVVEGELITEIGPRAAILERAAPGTPVIDLGGATILPGLIDCHVHLVFDASADPVAGLTRIEDRSLLLAMAGRARQLLDAGVTTARDLGDRNLLAVRLRDAIAAGQVPGPRVLSAGTPVTVTGGHCWFLGGEADGPEQIRTQVRRNLRDGADLTKIMVTGGTMTAGGPPPWQVQFTPGELSLAVTETVRFGRRVAAHVHGLAGISAALAAGVHTIEHCSFATADGRLEATARDRLIREIAEAGTPVCPTFSATLDAVQQRRGAEVLDPWLERVRRQYEAGVSLIAGTDAGIQDAPFDRYAEGLLWYSRAGLPAEAVLEMATTRAAAALGLSELTGRLAPGMSADLLAVAGDPRIDLRLLRTPVLVLARGRMHLPTDTVERISRSSLSEPGRPAPTGADHPAPAGADRPAPTGAYRPEKIG